MKFFPKSQFPVTVCQHRHGKDLTITEQSDTVQLRYPIEYYGFKHNIRAGAFLGYHYGTDWNDIATVEKLGNIRSDIYLNVGEVAASYDDAMAIIEPWFEALTKRKPSAVSFAGGNTGLAPMIVEHFLSGRNSATGQSNYTAYNQPLWRDLANTIRWYDDALSWSQVESEITAVSNSGGWFRNFTHWHNLGTSNVIYKQGEFYQTINDTLIALGKTAHFCSFGEATEYAMYRDLVSRAVCYKSVNGKLRIALEFDGLEDVLQVGQYATEKSIFLQDRLKTPVSVKIDLTGTEFSGKDFSSLNCDIIKLNANEFIVNVPFRIDPETNKIMVVELVETVTPDYRTFTKPTGTATPSGSALNVATDKPCYMVLFVKGTAEAEDKYTLKERNMFMKTEYSFTGLDLATKTYKVGIIDKFQNMNLL